MTAMFTEAVQGLAMLLDLALKSALLLALAWAVTRVLRGASAASRHLVWSAALGALLLLPALSLALPGWRVAWWPAMLTPAVPDVVDDVVDEDALPAALALAAAPLPREVTGVVRQQLLTPAPAVSVPTAAMTGNLSTKFIWKLLID